MKHPFLLFAVVFAAAIRGFAQAPAPDLTLRLNGTPASATPLELWRGEPVIAEVVLRHPGPSGAAPLVLEPPTGGWAARVQVLAADADGRRLPWKFAVTGRAVPDRLALAPDTVTTLVLQPDAASLAALAPGVYRLWARLDLGDGRGWNGVVRTTVSMPVKVIEPPASPTGAALGRRQLLRVRAALLAGDLPRAETATGEMLKADLKRPEGFVALALVEEAKGRKNLAGLAAMMATGLAANQAGPRLRPVGAKPEPELVPVEYRDLQERLPYEPSDGPLPVHPAATQAASVAKPAAPVPAPSVRPSVPDDTTFAQEPHGQWAIRAESSSQYGSSQWAAKQASGAPDVATYGDNGRAWASKTPDGSEEWIKLTFARPVHATAVRVRQTYNPGAITKVEAFAADGRTAVVWSGQDSKTYPADTIGWFAVTFAPPDFPVQAIKLTLDSPRVKGWNEIDAVQLVGEP